MLLGREKLEVASNGTLADSVLPLHVDCCGLPAFHLPDSALQDVFDLSCTANEQLHRNGLPRIERTLALLHAEILAVAVRFDSRGPVLYNQGRYDDTNYPETGMRIARKLGVVTYRSAMEWDGRFGRVRLDSEMPEDDRFGMEFQIESYLEGHAKRFVRSFDPNCYLYLGRSMDWFDLGEYAGGDVMAALASIRVPRSLSIGVQTDILFPLQQQQQVADGLRAGGTAADFVALPSPQGHDAFLVDIPRFGPVISNFLATL